MRRCRQSHDCKVLILNRQLLTRTDNMRKTNFLFRFLLIAVLSAATTFPLRAQEEKQATTTVTGQLVCSDCWTEADRKTTPFGTPADISCARDCAEKGIPSAVAVKEGDDYTLYLIEQSQLKSNRAEWLNAIGQQDEVNGRLYTKKGRKYVTVEGFKFLPTSSNSSVQQPSTVGSEAELVLKD